MQQVPTVVPEVKDPEVSQQWLRWLLWHGFDSLAPGPGTSTCHGCSQKKKKNVEEGSKVQSWVQTSSNWYYSHDRITMQNTETRAYCTAQETLLGIL